MIPDPHDPRLVPDHVHDDDGDLLYDARCGRCRGRTAQPPPGAPGGPPPQWELPDWLTERLDRVVGHGAGP